MQKIIYLVTQYSIYDTRYEKLSIERTRHGRCTRGAAMLLFSSYEVQRILNIDDNRSVLSTLGLDCSSPNLCGDAGSAVKNKKIKQRKARHDLEDTCFKHMKLEHVKSPNTLAAEAEERAERRRQVCPQVRTLFAYEDDTDFENEPDEEVDHVIPVPPREALNYDDNEVLMEADWRAWQLLFLTYNHVFDYMAC